MIEIDRGYVLVALVLAAAGMLLGLYMGIVADNPLLSVHVALMLSGFVQLAVYGFVFRLWPSMKKAVLARIQFWTAMIGSLALIAGSYLFATRGSVPLAAIGSILAIVASVMMVRLFWTHAGARGSGTGQARTMTDLMARTLNRLGQQRRGRLLFPGDERSVAATAIWPKPVGGMPRAVVHCRIPDRGNVVLLESKDRHLLGTTVGTVTGALIGF
jgi:hypothetical protein